MVVRSVASALAALVFGIIVLLIPSQAVGDSQEGDFDISARGGSGSITVTGSVESSDSPGPGSSADSSGSSGGASPVYRDGGQLCPGRVMVLIMGPEPGATGSTVWMCVDAPEVAPTEVPVVVTAADVSRLLVDGSGVSRQPPGPQARIDKIVIAYTSAASQTLTTTVAGRNVTVVATPVSYRWEWGDGTASTTTDPGAPYPNHSVYHDYRRTDAGVTITLTTTWEATFTPDGGDTQDVTGTITTTSTSPPFDLVRAVVALTDDAEEAQGH